MFSIWKRESNTDERVRYEELKDVLTARERIEDIVGSRNYESLLKGLLLVISDPKVRDNLHNDVFDWDLKEEDLNFHIQFDEAQKQIEKGDLDRTLAELQDQTQLDVHTTLLQFSLVLKKDPELAEFLIQEAHIYRSPVPMEVFGEEDHIASLLRSGPESPVPYEEAVAEANKFFKLGWKARAQGSRGESVIDTVEHNVQEHRPDMQDCIEFLWDYHNSVMSNPPANRSQIIKELLEEYEWFEEIQSEIEKGDDIEVVAFTTALMDSILNRESFRNNENEWRDHFNMRSSRAKDESIYSDEEIQYFENLIDVIHLKAYSSNVAYTHPLSGYVIPDAVIDSVKQAPVEDTRDFDEE